MYSWCSDSRALRFWYGRFLFSFEKRPHINVKIKVPFFRSWEMSPENIGFESIRARWSVWQSFHVSFDTHDSTRSYEKKPLTVTRYMYRLLWFWTYLNVIWKSYFDDSRIIFGTDFLDVSLWSKLMTPSLIHNSKLEWLSHFRHWNPLGLTWSLKFSVWSTYRTTKRKLVYTSSHSQTSTMDDVLLKLFDCATEGISMALEREAKSPTCNKSAAVCRQTTRISLEF